MVVSFVNFLINFENICLLIIDKLSFKKTVSHMMVSEHFYSFL